MCLGLIMIWIRDLETLLYLTTYVDNIWVGMCILLLVIVKFLRCSTPKRNKTDPRDSNKANDPIGQLKTLETGSFSLSTSICQWYHKIIELGSKKHVFSVPLFLQLIYLSICGIIILLPIIYTTTRVLYTLIFVLTGIPIYFIVVCPKNLPHYVLFINQKIMIMGQKLFAALPDEINE